VDSKSILTTRTIPLDGVVAAGHQRLETVQRLIRLLQFDRFIRTGQEILDHRFRKATDHSPTLKKITILGQQILIRVRFLALLKILILH
jgi:hypothetical protein